MYSYETFIHVSLMMKRDGHKLDDSIVENLNHVRRILQIPVIETIKKTVIVKKESTISEILKILNKISEKNYEKLKDELCVLVKSIDHVDDLNKITLVIFNIASSNLFYSKLFSKLYKELIEINRSFYDMFQVHYKKYFTELQSFVFMKTQDYDAFCDYTKKIHQLDSTLMFFINLMKSNHCDIENITELCLLLENKLIEDKDYDNVEQNEQFLHCVYIILKECMDYILFHENLESIVRKVNEIKLHPKLSPKMKFKCMDIDDIIKVHLVI
jgi:hypothetical protein